MLSENNPHTKRFQKLISELTKEVDSLKDEMKSLKEQNSQLKSELKEVKSEQSDIFSSLKETERMALKHQVKGLISKIDDHLEEQA